MEEAGGCCASFAGGLAVAGRPVALFEQTVGDHPIEGPIQFTRQHTCTVRLFKGLHERPPVAAAIRQREHQSVGQVLEREKVLNVFRHVWDLLTMCEQCQGVVAIHLWATIGRYFRPMSDITQLLHHWIDGDGSALDRLIPLVYPDLRRLAAAYLARGATPVTLQTTAVVNELFIRLLTNPPKRIESRRHFYVLAARIMRVALVDHYREAQAAKRGGGRHRVPLHAELAWVDAASTDILLLERALGELERMDREQAELFSVRFLLGCTAEEAGVIFGLSKATVDRRVRLARAWLYSRLRESA